MTRVLCRVNASARLGVGWGHLQRLLSLADALSACGAQARFLVNDDPVAVARVQQAGWAVETLPESVAWSADDARATIAAAQAQGCAVVVVDSDLKSEAYLGALRHAGLFVCAMDDNALHPLPCQLVVNGDLHAPQLDYAAIAGDARLLLGPSFVMMRREFWEVADCARNATVRNILLTLGGSDPFGLMPRLLDALDQVFGDFSVTVVIGPLFADVEAVERAARCSRHRVTTIHAPTSVRDLMQVADLAMTAGGQTLYELARVGCPALAIRLVDNQERQVRACTAAGFVRDVGHVTDAALLPRLRQMTAELLGDAAARLAMSRAGQALVDGQGALRVARALVEHVSDAQHIMTGQWMSGEAE